MPDARTTIYRIKETAVQEVTTEVLATPAQLLSAATGHPTVVKTIDGQQVLLRIPTAEEFRSEIEKGRESLLEEGFPAPPQTSDEWIAAAVRPLPDELLNAAVQPL